MNEAHSLPALIRQAWMRKGLTQRELAKRLGVGETTVRAWETGRHRPSLTLQSRLEDVLALSLSHVPQSTASLTAPPAEDVHPDSPLEHEPYERHGVLNRVKNGLRNRSRMLQRVQMYWISGILKQSLSHSMSLPLQLQENPLLVANPWSLDVQEAMSRPPSVLHQATSIVKAYDDADGALLIVGDAGAGKRRYCCNSPVSCFSGRVRMRRILFQWSFICHPGQRSVSHLQTGSSRN